nr:helix-turn-helix domain-containing protein [uncultured Anaerostipes sp.]
MISNQVLQETINGIKSITEVDLCILDLSGHPVVKTTEAIGDVEKEVMSFSESMAESQIIDGAQYFKIFDDKRLEYILMIQGQNENDYTIGRLVVLQIENLLTAYKERFDKENFVKNLLLDNLLLVDIYNRAKKLNIDVEARRIAFLIQTSYGRDHNLVEAMKQLDLVRESDFITAVDEKSVVYVTEVEEQDSQEHFIGHASQVVKALEEADILDVKIAIGNPADNIKDVSRSYKEAQIGLEVSKIFYEESTVIAYNQLGIGRLIYQLPLPLCKMFIKEVFGDYSPDSIEEETLVTIDKFFENNLNVSETSRQLFIHRNTLVYRLDKIQKNTNLDLRNFEDAIAFKIALMVVKYMKYMDTMD